MVELQAGQAAWQGSMAGLAGHGLMSFGREDTMGYGADGWRA